MAYILSGTTIRSPMSFKESNSTQVVQQRTLDGTVSRDYFGSKKRVWTLDFKNVNPTAYTTILSIYNTYLSTVTAVTWSVTEANYAVAETSVHIDMQNRSFSVRGNSYISDFTLILTEA